MTDGSSSIIGSPTQESGAPATRRARWGSSIRSVRHADTFGLLLFLIALGTFFSLKSPYFLAWSNFSAIAVAMSVYLTIACVQTIVLVSGGVDLSIMSTLALSGLAVQWALVRGWPPVLVLGCGLAIGIIVGLTNALIIVGVGVNALVATIGTAFAVRGLALIWTGGQPQDYFTDSWLNEIGNGTILGVRTPIVIALSVFLVVLLAMRFTRFGSRVYAIGGSEYATRMSGISVKRLRTLVYVLSGHVRCARRVPAHVDERHVVPDGGVWRGAARARRRHHRRHRARRRPGDGLRNAARRPPARHPAERLQPHRRPVLLADLHPGDHPDRRRHAGRDPEKGARQMSATETRPPDAGPGRVVLHTRGLVKHYGSITAVDGVDIDIHAGEILAIVGDNGAGKSTLIKMLCGAIQPDSGELYLEGREGHVHLGTPHAARALGIETVFQDLALAPNRDVVSNLFLGREIYYGGALAPLRVLNTRAMKRQAREQLAELRINLPGLTGFELGQMSGGQRQSVAIARAAFWASRILLMDEPTAALGVRESGAVLRLARSVADAGVAVVMVSHVLPHVMELADRVVVMRGGRKVAELTEGIEQDRLISLIVGAERQAWEQAFREQPGEE